MTTDIQNSGERQEEAAVPSQDVENRTQQSEQAENQAQDPNEVIQGLKSAVQSERANRQHVEDELKMIKDHLSLMQAREPAAAAQKDALDELDDSDVMTVGEFKKATSKIASNFQMTLQELKMTQKYPDYQEVISKYLPDILKQRPELRDSLQKTQDYELAYYLAKNSDTYREENKKSKKNADAQRIVENSQKAGNLSSIGATSPISQARRYKEMSDTDFRELVNKNMGQF